MTKATHRILLVDDEPRLRAEVSRGLAQYGMEVVNADSVAAARAALNGARFDLVLLDLTMPVSSGWALLPTLVEDLQVPVIVLTANLDVTTRVRAFREGASDYIAKPFFIEEVVARIRTRLRVEKHGGAKTVFAFADCVVDLERRSVAAAGAGVELTQAEFDILAYFAARPGRAISRAQLAEHAMKGDGERVDRTIDSHVSRIRAKLGDAGKRIETVWGIGWKLIGDDAP